MNKKIIKPIILSITAIIILVISTIVYAWYTNVDRVNQELDGSTNDIVLDYEIEKEGEIITSYTISNLTFFDINNENESQYLSSMAVCLKLNIKNYSKNAVDVKIAFNDPVTTNEDGTLKAYVDGIVCDKAEIEIPDKISIKDYIDDPDNSTRSYLIENMEMNVDSTTDTEPNIVYVYLFGVQPNDSADNDFLYTVDNSGNKTYVKYNFTITIEATKPAA